MHDQEKSDSAIVAAKPPNKAGKLAAEVVEPRAGTEGNADQQSTLRTQSRARVTQARAAYGKPPERRFAVTHPR
jgi:RNA-directed DNA polymerase